MLCIHRSRSNADVGAGAAIPNPLGRPEKLVTCSPSLKGRGFSVQRPSHRRDSPKGLPGPLDISGRILVAVQHQPTGGTDMGAHRERLIDPLPTECSIRADSGAILGGERRRYRFHSLASVCCFAGEDTTEGIPSGVLNAFVEARLARGPIMPIAAVAIGNRCGASV